LDFTTIFLVLVDEEGLVEAFDLFVVFFEVVLAVAGDGAVRLGKMSFGELWKSISTLHMMLLYAVMTVMQI